MKKRKKDRILGSSLLLKRDIRGNELEASEMIDP
jgi:hypothetical protein